MSNSPPREQQPRLLHQQQNHHQQHNNDNNDDDNQQPDLVERSAASSPDRSTCAVVVRDDFSAEQRAHHRPSSGREDPAARGGGQDAPQMPTDSQRQQQRNLAHPPHPSLIATAVDLHAARVAADMLLARWNFPGASEQEVHARAAQFTQWRVENENSGVEQEFIVCQHARRQASRATSAQQQQPEQQQQNQQHHQNQQQLGGAGRLTQKEQRRATLKQSFWFRVAWWIAAALVAVCVWLDPEVHDGGIFAHGGGKSSDSIVTGSFLRWAEEDIVKAPVLAALAVFCILPCACLGCWAFVQRDEKPRLKHDVSSILLLHLRAYVIFVVAAAWLDLPIDLELGHAHDFTLSTGVRSLCALVVPALTCWATFYRRFCRFFVDRPVVRLPLLVLPIQIGGAMMTLWWLAAAATTSDSIETAPFTLIGTLFSLRSTPAAVTGAIVARLCSDIYALVVSYSAALMVASAVPPILYAIARSALRSAKTLFAAAMLLQTAALVGMAFVWFKDRSDWWAVAVLFAAVFVWRSYCFSGEYEDGRRRVRGGGGNNN